MSTPTLIDATPRRLGSLGLVGPLALGQWRFTNEDVSGAQRVVEAALDAGLNLIDTADRYSQGGSETLIGKAIAGRRDDVVLATKFNGPMGDDPNRRGNSRRWITRAVEDSLRRLQTDHIDLYQAHRPDDTVDLEETLSALTDLVRLGKVRAIGTSALPPSEIVEAHAIAERHGLQRFRTEQPPYSLLNRGIEREVLPVAQRYGMGVLVWGPLGQGLLTGRVRRGGVNDLRRAGVFRHLNDDRRLDVVEQLIPLADLAGALEAVQLQALGQPWLGQAVLSGRAGGVVAPAEQGHGVRRRPAHHRQREPGPLQQPGAVPQVWER